MNKMQKSQWVSLQQAIAKTGDFLSPPSILGWPWSQRQVYQPTVSAEAQLLRHDPLHIPGVSANWLCINGVLANWLLNSAVKETRIPGTRVHYSGYKPGMCVLFYSAERHNNRTETCTLQHRHCRLEWDEDLWREGAGWGRCCLYILLHWSSRRSGRRWVRHSNLTSVTLGGTGTTSWHLSTSDNHAAEAQARTQRSVHQCWRSYISRSRWWEGSLLWVSQFSHQVRAFQALTFHSRWLQRTSWPRILGSHSVGKENSNGTLLLQTCSQQVAVQSQLQHCPVTKHCDENHMTLLLIFNAPSFCRCVFLCGPPWRLGLQHTMIILGSLESA